MKKEITPIYPTKKSISILQKIYKIVGDCGGNIKVPTDDYLLEVKLSKKDEYLRQGLQVGVYKEEERIRYDPAFNIDVLISDGKIMDAVIKGYLSQTYLCNFIIDERNIMTSIFDVNKDDFGLKKRFSDFMNTMDVLFLMKKTRRIESYGECVDRDDINALFNPLWN